MNKKLVLLPFAALLLSGCLPGQGSSSSQAPASSSATTGTPRTAPSAPTVPGPTTVEPGPSEYQGYSKVTTKPVDQKEYILGYYQANLKKNCFINGHHHVDDKGEYPYYLTTTEDVTKAVRVRIAYEANGTDFKIMNVGGGEYDTYNGKYLRIYEGQKEGGSKVTSLGFYDPAHPEIDPTNPSHTVTHTTDSFQFYGDYSYGGVSFTVNTIAAMFNDGTHDPQAVFVGTYEQYTSLSAVTPNRLGSNFIAYLWEAK